MHNPKYYNQIEIRPGLFYYDKKIFLLSQNNEFSGLVS